MIFRSHKKETVTMRVVKNYIFPTANTIKEVQLSKKLTEVK